MEKNQLWQSVLGELELSLSKANFTTWFKGTYISSFENNRVVIAVPNTFTKAWLEKKFKKPIYEILQKITSNQIKEIGYKVENRGSEAQTKVAATPSDARETTGTLTTAGFSSFKEIAPDPKADELPRPLPEFSLNDKYVFDNFIVGKCNELAHAAAKAVANNPGKSYNPLFIYGGVGLGKTHLLQAIGNHVKKMCPNHKILYVSSEKFGSDFVRAIATKRIADFKNIYRKVDLLLMDDVQFMAGKEGTQEEFFYTFNELYQSNKQVAVTSDRPPKAIPALENRLLSRFEWGMIADISTLDLETRTAILQKKAQEKALSLSLEVIEFMARTIQNNVREMEGALNRLNAHIELHKISPTLENVKSILSSINTLARNENISSLKIIKTISTFFEITIDDLLGKCREKRLVYPRQLTMFLLREELRSSFPAIGNELGGRDHTTAMHACQKIANDLELDEKVRQDLTLIKQKLYQS